MPHLNLPSIGRMKGKTISTGVALAIAVGCLGGLVLLVGFASSSDSTTKIDQSTRAATAQLRKAQLSGCKRGKEDRIQDSSVYSSMASYYRGITQAKSVKGDVKKIAADVEQKLLTAARGKASRIYVCKPLIDHNKKIPDGKALRQLPRDVWPAALRAAPPAK